MKVFLFLMGLSVAGILGYTLEPQLRYTLTGEKPVLEEARKVEKVVTAGQEDVSEKVAELPKTMQVEEEAKPEVSGKIEAEVVIPKEKEAAIEPPPAAAVAVVPPVAVAPVKAGPADVVGVMQASIKGGEIKEFSFDQVLEWQATDGPEKFDGETYQTGIAAYKAETVFGVKTIQAKALIKDGKVVRWLWPKSGMEIK